ncbi:MAG: hypothetical protein JW763_02585 [candidate division Zixibacteria bacterium]|nr:hypothetical protein [candidate division Zixibacteria bacterium]
MQEKTYRNFNVLYWILSICVSIIALYFIVYPSVQKMMLMPGHADSVKVVIPPPPPIDDSMFTNLFADILIIDTTNMVNEDFWELGFDTTELVRVIFSMVPQRRNRYAEYVILDKNGVVMARKDSADVILELPPGEYGFAFIDRHKVWFEDREGGFTVERDQ